MAIVGRPNVGKSTLFNRLAGAERAIVTAVPGTTRDVMTEAVMLLGTRMLLADTAGVRESSDPIEREGVARAEKAGRGVGRGRGGARGSAPLTEEDFAVLRASQGRPRVIAMNKSDLRVQPAMARPAKRPGTRRGGRRRRGRPRGARAEVADSEALLASEGDARPDEGRLRRLSHRRLRAARMGAEGQARRRLMPGRRLPDSRTLEMPENQDLEDAWIAART